VRSLDLDPLSDEDLQATRRPVKRISLRHASTVAATHCSRGQVRFEV
jgi:hypothetical protein